MPTCYLGVGSNVGNRRKFIKLAIQMINALPQTRVIKVSKAIQTLPVGGPAGQNKFLNAALKISTKSSPLKLLKQLKNIENKLGRTKTVRFGPRCIDLDILLYADKVVKDNALKIPHPRMFSRDFVIQPLLEVI
ncbi:MAG: 2-amino-4-hydroxy-6-hydroxymethyldihydropteridine diphosphokinase [Candidatus Omnitrophota bacterium]